MQHSQTEFESLLEDITTASLKRESRGFQKREVISQERHSLDTKSLRHNWIDGIGLEASYQRFKEIIEPGLSMSNGPKYLGLVTGGVTPAALIGDFLCSLWDQSVITHDDSLAAKTERLCIDLLRELFALPEDFDGLLTTGATAANLVALTLARDTLGSLQGVNIPQAGIDGLSKIRVFSALPHASILKSLAILGLGRDSLTAIPCRGDSAQIDIHYLEQALIKADGAPCIVVASAGEVNTGEFDPLTEIAALCKNHGAWLHVDAAFGLFAKLAPGYQALCRGVEEADSITTDLHKWLNVPYDCGLVFSKHAKRLPLSFHSQAAYLDSNCDSCLDNIAPMHLGIENSRRFRALPALFTLLCYGRSGYSNMVSRHCDLARQLSEAIEQSDDYALCYPHRLNIVIFKHKQVVTPRDNARLLSTINASGRVYMTATIFQGKPAIRAAFCNWRTTHKDVIDIIDCLKNAASMIDEAQNEII